MVLKYVENENYKIQCEKCGIQYIDSEYKRCEPCQINYLKSNFTNWTSENKKIDDFIQNIQLRLDDDRIFEWVSYNQFNDTKEINKKPFITTYSAIWRNGPLYYNYKSMNG